MFYFNTTIWTCACCQIRVWIDADVFLDGKSRKCPNCGHVNLLAYHPDQKEE